MARMYARRKGKSRSKRPPTKVPPEWVSLKPEEVEELVCTLYKEGHPPSIIGLILRDQYGVPCVKALCRKSITQILKERGFEIKYPEDLMNLMKKAVNLRKHLEKHKKDIHNRRALQLIENKIRRLAEYYVEKGILPEGWVYKPEEAALIVKGA